VEKWVKRQKTLAALWGFSALASLTAVAAILGVNQVAVVLFLGGIWFGILLYKFRQLALRRARAEQQRVSADSPEGLYQGPDSRPATFREAVILTMVATALIGLILILLAWPMDRALTGLLGRSELMIGITGMVGVFCVLFLPGILVGGLFSAILRTNVVAGSFWGGYFFSFITGSLILGWKDGTEAQVLVVALVGASIGALCDATGKLFDGRPHRSQGDLLLVMAVLATFLAHPSTLSYSPLKGIFGWSMGVTVVLITLQVAVAALVTKLGRVKSRFGFWFVWGAYSMALLFGTLGTAVTGALVVSYLGSTFPGSLGLLVSEMVGAAFGGAVGVLVLTQSDELLDKETDNLVERQAKAWWRKVLNVGRQVDDLSSPSGQQTGTKREPGPIPRSREANQWLAPLILLGLSNVSMAWLLFFR
jgi:hypothetical protein